MPVYVVTAPDGREYEIEAPDGATQDEVLSYAQANYQQAAPPSREDRYADLQRRAAQMPQSDPTEGMSGFDKFMAGVGKSVFDTGRGIKQLYGELTDNGPTLSGLITGESADDQRRREIERQRQLDAPLMADGAGMVGNIAGQAAQMAIPVGGAARMASIAGRAAPYVGAATRAGVFGGAQGVGMGETRAGNAGTSAAFGAAGQGVASAAGGLARGIASRMAPADRALLQTADDAGLRFGAGQVSQNPLVRTMASQMDRLPFSGAGKRAGQNQDAFNQAVSSTFGMPANKVTPEVFAKAQARLGDAFEELTARNNLQISSQRVSDMRAVVDEAKRLGGPDTARKVQAWADELVGKVDESGVIPGRAYQSFDSRIGKELKSGGESAHYLGALRDVIRGAMDESVSPADRAAWQAIRQQYANLKTVEPLVAKSPTGDISGQALMGRVTADKAGKARMARGNGGALGELAKIGQRYMKEAPNSGTADRLLVNAGIAGGLYGGSQAGVIDPATATKLGALLLLNRGASGLLRARGPVMGDSRTLTGLARLLKPAPFLLPAAGAAAMEVPVSGGRVATPEEIARDEEIVRRFRNR